MLKSIGPMELVIILLIVILLFGGRKIPEIAKGLGKGIRDFKGAISGNSENSDENKALKKSENQGDDASAKT